MFVRWQERRRQGTKYNRVDTTQLRAVLVESVRVDGKPTQRHVAYLGSITDSGIEILAQRCFFWVHVTERLDRLGNQITVEDRQRIEAAVAEKVPRPTPDERVASARDCAELFGWEDLSDRERALLKDEAGQWEGKDGSLAAALKGVMGARPQRCCSFCGESENEAHTLIAGAASAALICDECVEAAAKLIAERKATPA